MFKKYDHVKIDFINHPIFSANEITGIVNQNEPNYGENFYVWVEVYDVATF
jgi:hypothetical protein